MEQINSVNVMLTARDEAILQSLYANCVMTFSQIARKHFPEVAKPTIINRLTKLEMAGVICRERIPRMALGRDKNAIGVVFQITKRGILELRQRQLGTAFRTQPVSFHPYTLHHDLILVDLADAISIRFGGCKITNGKLAVDQSQGPKAIEPDLEIHLPEGQGKVAIELELSGKSEKRYREIVLRYRLSKEYQQVIYFVDDPFIKLLMTRVILGRNPHPQEKANTGKFYFSGASEFINHPKDTPITNGVQTLWEKGGPT